MASVLAYNDPVTIMVVFFRDRNVTSFLNLSNYVFLFSPLFLLLGEVPDTT